MNLMKKDPNGAPGDIPDFDNIFTILKSLFVTF